MVSEVYVGPLKRIDPLSQLGTHSKKKMCLRRFKTENQSNVSSKLYEFRMIVYILLLQTLFPHHLSHLPYQAHLVPYKRLSSRRDRSLFLILHLISNHGRVLTRENGSP